MRNDRKNWRVAARTKSGGTPMRSKRLMRAVAWMLADSLVNTMSPRLRPEERGEALFVFYRMIHDGLESYEEVLERMQVRHDPTGSWSPAQGDTDNREG
jgi:hypothetical protein